MNLFPEFLYVEECLNQITADRPEFIVEAAQLGVSIPAAFGLRIGNVRCGCRAQSQLNIILFVNELDGSQAVRGVCKEQIVQLIAFNECR
ncbi:hypothetical protein WT72_24305 [Burkholderia pseudomultivorans]|nr:hypothetical protein WT72_24305 [Burkholderia pseudomultivorans]